MGKYFESQNQPNLPNIKQENIITRKRKVDQVENTEKPEIMTNEKIKAT
jgi:hypothetical protein